MNLLYVRIRNLVGGFKALHDVCKKQAPGHCSVLQTLLSCPGPQEGLKIKGSNKGPFCFYSCQNLHEQLTPNPLMNSEFHPGIYRWRIILADTDFFQPSRSVSVANFKGRLNRPNTFYQIFCSFPAFFQDVIFTFVS